MEMNNIPQDLLDKIQKIINLKEGAESIGSLHEAETAALRLQSLLLKHNLDLETVQKSQINKKRESITDEHVDLRDQFNKVETEWVPKLYRVVAENYLCKVYWYTNSVTIIGKKDNIAFVCYVCEQLVAKIRIIEKLMWAKYDELADVVPGPPKEKRGTFRRGFLNGAVDGINIKLRGEMSNAQKDYPFAIMIVHNKEDIFNYEMYGTTDPDEVARKKEEEQKKRDKASKDLADMINAMTPEERKKWDKKQQKRGTTKYRALKGPRQTSSTQGWRSGYEKGKNMDINKGLTSTKQGNLGL